MYLNYCGLSPSCCTLLPYRSLRERFHIAQTFRRPDLLFMAPAASRLLGAGAALGLASTFVAPVHHSQSATLRGSKVDTSAAVSNSINSQLATLAAAGVSLAAIGAATSRNRVNLKSASQVAETATPPPFQPSEQFGASEPLGFFDPLGFTAPGDEKGFRKLRVSEIKHGRVA